VKLVAPTASSGKVGLPLPLAGEGRGANRPGVLEIIVAAIAERAPTLTLPQKGGREEEKP
jgi:hypothetical protein